MRTLCRGALCLTAAAALSACIDEDLSRCGKDYALTYRFLLQTSLDETLARELTTPAERQLATPLRAALAPLFSEQAQDLTLHFHHPATGERLYYEEHLVGSREAGFTLYLPEQDYSHVALANLGAEPAARTTGAASLSSLAFDKPTHDLVIESQERIKQAKSALSYLALSNKWAEKAERYQGLVDVYADLERFYRQNVALYNSDVEAYNYWRSIPGYRPIFHILGFKSRPGI